MEKYKYEVGKEIKTVRDLLNVSTQAGNARYATLFTYNPRLDLYGVVIVTIKPNWRTEDIQNELDMYAKEGLTLYERVAIPVQHVLPLCVEYALEQFATEYDSMKSNGDVTTENWEKLFAKFKNDMDNYSGGKKND